MSERYQLSRRKTLAGLATIGAAGAGAGLGTSALFSDEESFEGNVVEAGTLDMSVTAEVVAHVDNDYWNGLDLEATEADGEVVTAINVGDVKPGDWAIVCFTADVSSNPGYVQTTASGLVNNENGLTDPESEVDSSGGDPGEGNGELQDEMLAEVYQEFDPADDGDPPRSHLSGEDPTGPQGSTVQETYDNFSDGAIWTNSDGEPAVVGSNSSGNSTGSGGTGEYGPVEFCLLLWVPRDVGNVIQGDSFEFDLTFSSEQVRNNPDPFNSSS